MPARGAGLIVVPRPLNPPAACAQGFECQVVHGALELLMAGAVRSIIAEVPSQLLPPTLTLTLSPDLGRNLDPNPNHYAD